MREPSHGLDHQRFTFQNDHPYPSALLPLAMSAAGTSCRDESDDECSEKVALTDYGCCPSTMPSEHGLLWELWPGCGSGRPPSIV